jgi:hypothetical protein
MIHCSPISKTGWMVPLLGVGGLQGGQGSAVVEALGEGDLV